MNPFDPRAPLYEGQALRNQQPQQQVVQPTSTPMPQSFAVPPVAMPPAVASPQGLHFLEGLLGLGMGAAQIFGLGQDNGEDDEDEAPARRVRPRFTSARPTAGRVGKGGCCNARRPKA